MFTKEKYLNIVENVETIKEIGRVTEIKGLIIESDGPEASIGDLCYIYKKNEDVPIWSEVVGFKEGKILLDDVDLAKVSDALLNIENKLKG